MVPTPAFLCGGFALYIYLCKKQVMIVPNEKYTKWKLLAQRGDAKAITESAGGKYKQISVYKALQHGQASMALQDIIDAYYDQKAKKIKELAQQL
jgi:hypothetical protein